MDGKYNNWIHISDTNIMPNHAKAAQVSAFADEMFSHCLISPELREDEVRGGRQWKPGEGRLGRHRLCEETDQVGLSVQRSLRTYVATRKMCHFFIDELNLIDGSLVIIFIAAVMRRLIKD